MKKIFFIKNVVFCTIFFLSSSLMRYDVKNITIYNVIILLFISVIISYLLMLWAMKKNKERSDLSNILIFLQALHRQNKIKKVTDIISIVRTNSLNLEGEYQITIQDGDDTLTYTSTTYTTWFSLKEFWVFCALLGGVVIYILFSEMNQDIPKVLYITPALVLFTLSEGVFFIRKKYLPKDLRQKGISIVNIIRNDHADMTTLYRGEYSKTNEYFSCSWNESSSRNDGPSKQIIHQ